MNEELKVGGKLYIFPFGGLLNFRLLESIYWSNKFKKLNPIGISYEK